MVELTGTGLSPADVIAEYMAHALPEQSMGRAQIAPDTPRMGTGEARLQGRNGFGQTQRLHNVGFRDP